MNTDKVDSREFVQELAPSSVDLFAVRDGRVTLRLGASAVNSDLAIAFQMDSTKKGNFNPLMRVEV